MADEDAPARGPGEQLMRQALLRELERAPDDDRAPATMLEKIARTFVARAGDGDLAAIKEVYDRVDGKPLPAVAGGEQRPATRIVKWMD